MAPVSAGGCLGQRFDASLRAWGSARFRDVFKMELESVPITELPLQQGLEHSSHVSSEAFTVMVLADRAEADCIVVKAGVFYSGIIAGCSCTDDPTPVDEISEYCEIEVMLARASGMATVRVLGSD